MARLTLTLPICPSTNALYCCLRGRAQRVKSTAYRQWIKAARGHLWAQKPPGGFPFFTGTFHVLIEVPERMTGDVDNRQKAAIDFLKKGVGCIPDDRKAYAAHVTRSPSVEPGFCRITVSDEPLMLVAA
jgi:Holliday junction resolvase RusA-like endonuclease